MYLKVLSIVPFLLTIGSVALYGQEKLAAEGSAKLQGFDFEFPSMGTLIQISVYCEDESKAQKAVEEARKEVQRLAAILTDYDPESETRQLTSRAFNAPTSVSDPLWRMLSAAEKWNKITDGAFDCSLGMLTQTWRKHRRANRIPDKATVEQAKSHCGWDKVRLDPSAKTVTIADQELRLDFGAIGKGYIADVAFDILKQHGLDCCLINISGNMRCGSAPPGKAGWTIAISPLDREGAPIRKIAIANQAIATSGDLWQYVVVDGVKRSHILDPKTGYGVVGPLAVTAIAPTAEDADALATTGCLLSWDEYRKILSQHMGTAALRASRVTEQLQVDATDNFPQPLP